MTPELLQDCHHWPGSAKNLGSYCLGACVGYPRASLMLVHPMCELRPSWPQLVMVASSKLERILGTGLGE